MSNKNFTSEDAVYGILALIAVIAVAALVIGVAYLITLPFAAIGWFLLFFSSTDLSYWPMTGLGFGAALVFALIVGGISQLVQAWRQ